MTLSASSLTLYHLLAVPLFDFKRPNNLNKQIKRLNLPTLEKLTHDITDKADSWETGLCQRHKENLCTALMAKRTEQKRLDLFVPNDFT